MMDAQVETMVQGFRIGYDALAASLSDCAEKKELDAVFHRIESLAEASPDVMTFSTKAMEENLFMKFSEASGKASAALQEQRKKAEKEGKTSKPTLTQFLQTYRGLLDMHKTKLHTGYTVRVHEEYLGLAKDFSEDDIPGFLAEAERRGLTVPLAVSAVYDEWAGNLRKLDPHDKIMIEQYTKCAACALGVRSGEELDYHINREIVKYRRVLAGEEYKRLLHIRLVGAIQDYEMCKLSLFATGDIGKYLPGLLIARRFAKGWYEMLVEHFGFDWDAYFADPFNRKQPTNFGFALPDCMAVWESWHPDALPAMKRLLFEEILPMPSVAAVTENTNPAGIPATPVPEQKAQFGIDAKVAETAARLRSKAFIPECSVKPEGSLRAENVK